MVKKMRVIAGKYKRTPIKTLDGEDITRPTRDMVKEALFSSITIYSDSKFLDLFSGTGAIGIEALSRGALDCVFNDVNKKAYKIIAENLNKVHEDRRLFNLDYKLCLEKLNGESFDYIYADPPYAFNEYDELFNLVSKYNLLDKKGIIIVEVNKDTVLNDEYFDICKYKEKIYGINKLLYYKRYVND